MPRPWALVYNAFGVENIRMTATSPNRERIEHRNLRIAFSAVCGILCLLVLMLWVRSYWWGDVVYVRPAPTPDFVGLYSIRGQVTLDALYGPGRHPNASIAWYWGRTWRRQQDYQHATVREPLNSVLGFSSYSDNEYQTLSVPHWSLLLLFASLVATPWIHWSYRFSLRTLLIATTIVAALLGAVVWAVR
jgi:hypothetical protein